MTQIFTQLRRRNPLTMQSNLPLISNEKSTKTIWRTSLSLSWRTTSWVGLPPCIRHWLTKKTWGLSTMTALSLLACTRLRSTFRRPVYQYANLLNKQNAETDNANRPTCQNCHDIRRRDLTFRLQDLGFSSNLTSVLMKDQTTRMRMRMRIRLCLSSDTTRAQKPLGNYIEQLTNTRSSSRSRINLNPSIQAWHALRALSTLFGHTFKERRP